MGVEIEVQAPSATSEKSNSFEKRRQSIEQRVFDAAYSLLRQGVRPTTHRVREALGGGSPNDIAPALKHWRQATLSGTRDPTVPAPADATLPSLIADLTMEFWRRALAAAAQQLKGDSAGDIPITGGTEEAQALREQLNLVREQLERELIAFAELRARAARHEAIAKQALQRATAAEARERGQLHEIGSMSVRIAELEAQLKIRDEANKRRAQLPQRPKSRS